MFDLHQTELDGVHCFWVESGRPTLTASLVFRYGMVDEPLTQSGWLHLLEHLALHGRGGGRVQLDGSVSALHTMMTVRGPSENVVTQLGDISTWLAKPAFSELDRERRVIRAEASIRNNAATRAFIWRFGASGPGVIGQGEPGMGRATPELLTDMSRRVFTRQNAVLVLDGPPPADAHLSLADGEMIEPPRAIPLHQAVPAAYVDERGPILSGMVTRSLGAVIARSILHRALEMRLRETDGGAYAPWASYEPLDAAQALLIGGSDLLPEMLPTLAETALQLAEALRSEPVPQAWFDDCIEERLQALDDPHLAVGLASRAASDYLEHRPAVSHNDMRDEVRGLEAGAVAEVLAEFSNSLLLGIPGETAWDNQLPMLTFPQTHPRSDGHHFRSVNWPATPARLTLTPTRVELSDGRSARAVDVAGVAGLLTYKNGSRHLITHDGWGLDIHPETWRNGAAAVDIIDALVPARLHLPQPAHPSSPSVALARGRRWWLGLRRATNTPASLRVYQLLAGILAIIGLFAGQIIAVIAGAVAAIALHRELATIKQEKADLSS